MIPIIDFERRSLEGPTMTASEFDDFLMETAMELVEEYDLNFDRDVILADDERADAVFAAAKEFLARVGLYNRTSSRVIKWTPEEIEEMCTSYKNNPHTLTVGAGKEEYTIQPRTANDGKEPIIWAGGGPLFNAAFIEPSIRAFLKEPATKGFMKAGGVTKVEGMDARAGFPSELAAQLLETDTQLEVLKKVGREGFFMGNVNCPSPTATALCFREGRYAPTQCMAGVHIAPEMKIDWSRFQAALVCEDLGVTPWASAMSMVGGLAGGPGGAAMVTTANMLAQISYSHAPWCNIAISDMRGSSKSPLTLSCISAVLRAAGKHLAIPTAIPCCDSTQVTCFEEAIIGACLIAFVSAVSGMAVNWFGGTSPLTVGLHDKVMKYACGLTNEEAEIIVHKLLALQEQVKADHEGQVCPFPSQLFFAIYDLQTLEPKGEYQTAFDNAVQMLKETGIPL